MPTVGEYRKRIQALTGKGYEMGRAFVGIGPDGKKTEKQEPTLLRDYTDWYTEAYQVVKFLLPDRLSEFENLYLADTRRKEMNGINYTIQDWLLTRRPRHYVDGRKDFDEVTIVGSNLLAQIQIVESCLLALDSILMNFKKMTLSNLFDSELDGARELHKNGFLRPAGVITRVVLEKHLKEVCEAHKVKVTKKNRNKPPVLSDYNESLKKEKVYDIAQWRRISALTDITNKCCHDNDPEPTEDEVRELIDATERVVKTVF